jgi:hypothetical protein
MYQICAFIYFKPNREYAQISVNNAPSPDLSLQGRGISS